MPQPICKNLGGGIERRASPRVARRAEPRDARRVTCCAPGGRPKPGSLTTLASGCRHTSCGRSPTPGICPQSFEDRGRGPPGRVRLSSATCLPEIGFCACAGTPPAQERRSWSKPNSYAKTRLQLATNHCFMSCHR